MMDFVVTNSLSTFWRIIVHPILVLGALVQLPFLLYPQMQMLIHFHVPAKLIKMCIYGQATVRLVV